MFNKNTKKHIRFIALHTTLLGFVVGLFGLFNTTYNFI